MRIRYNGGVHIPAVFPVSGPDSIAADDAPRRPSYPTGRASAATPDEILVVGADRGLRSVMEQVAQVAPTDAPVMLTGETGSGKEVVARLIHARSARARGPMVRVNCGAIAPELVDSELFGHERGSFTGASQTRLGWFERAHGGTLFLDEVAELSLAAQVRLLRVLQDGELERVGGSKSVRVDVRVVTATHRDLRSLCARGEMREDLFYRLAVFSVEIPPLRERLCDLPALAAHFAERAGLRLSGTPLTVARDDLELLLSHPWPGNVRELSAVVERAAILGNGARLEVARALEGHGASVTAPRTGEAFATLAAATRRHIEEALSRTRGRIEGPNGAAALLGLNPHTLRGKMRKLGVEWSRFRETALERRSA
ncbi:MAG: sigma-54-dependent Fis family transcriptional regulator [Polyangiaceae bacterium]|nr:sigma-54-dependent Fis family transcriptional regulator [Polyangiaceae bacterium]